jgi:hypothetical protein
MTLLVVFQIVIIVMEDIIVIVINDGVKDVRLKCVRNLLPKKKKWLAV